MTPIAGSGSSEAVILEIVVSGYLGLHIRPFIGLVLRVRAVIVKNHAHLLVLRR